MAGSRSLPPGRRVRSTSSPVRRSKSALLVAWCRAPLRGRGGAGRHFDDVVRRPAGRQPLPFVAVGRAAGRDHADQPFGAHRGRDVRRRTGRGARPRSRPGRGRLVAREAGRAFAPGRSEPRHRRCHPRISSRCSARPTAGCPTMPAWPWRGDGSCRRQNIFRYPLGHLGMPVQLARDIGAVRAAQAGVGGNVAPVRGTSRTSLLRTARPNWSKLSATIMNEPGPPMTFSS